MNPLLMKSVQLASFTPPPDPISSVHKQTSELLLDSNGFPSEIIHDLKIIVETFKVLIKSQWEYKINKNSQVQWLPEMFLNSSEPSLNEQYLNDS